MHHILFYDYVPDVVERRAPHREAHLARLREHESIVMAGALGDPVRGAAIVFEDATAEEIEDFVQSDPYVEAGLVTAWRIEPWTVV